MGIKYTEIESGSLEVFLSGIEEDASDIGLEIAEKSAEAAKELAIAKLFALKRAGRLPKSRQVHMFQDVKIYRQPSKSRVQVGGGSKTGTLWHIVNDGTYRTKPTHFMDQVIKELDNQAKNY